MSSARTKGKHMGDLLLHQTKGVNPKLTICAWCGKDVSVALLGAHEGVYECRQCKRTHIGGRPKSCPCGARDYGNFVKTRNIGEYEKLNIGELCDDCSKKKEEHDRVVAEGGIYWKCAECHSAGVIKADAPLSKDVREQMGIQPPKPCGIEFDKAHCPVCRETTKAEGA